MQKFHYWVINGSNRMGLGVLEGYVFSNRMGLGVPEGYVFSNRMWLGVPEGYVFSNNLQQLQFIITVRI